MKVKTALRRSIVELSFAVVLLLIAAGLASAYPNAFTLAFLGFVAFYLVGDLVNIVYIRRKAARDPGYLEETID